MTDFMHKVYVPPVHIARHSSTTPHIQAVLAGRTAHGHSASSQVTYLQSTNCADQDITGWPKVLLQARPAVLSGTQDSSDPAQVLCGEFSTEDGGTPRNWNHKELFADSAGIRFPQSKTRWAMDDPAHRGSDTRPNSEPQRARLMGPHA